MNNRKQLLMDYKYRKTEMGVFIFACTTTGKSYIGFTQDTKATINSNSFKLGVSMHTNKKLQNDWNSYGESAFDIRVLEVLPYDEKDEVKADYTKELQELCDGWIKKTNESEEI